MRLPTLLLSFLIVSVAPARGQVDDLAQAVARAETIVVARCAESISHWDTEAGIIVTDVTLAVDETIKGHHGATITVRTLGGRVGATGMGTSHAAHFAPGTKVVALLRQSRFGPYLVAASSQSSVLAVADDDRVELGPRTMRIHDLVDWIQASAP